MTGGGGGAIVLGLGSSTGPYIVGNTFPDGTVRGAYGGSRMGFSADGFSFDYSSTTSGARSWSTYMRITSGGDVGIGTTSPSRKLDVLGNTRVYGSSGNDVSFTLQSQGSSAPYLVLNGSLSSYNLLRFQYAGTDYAGIGAFNSDITSALSFYTNGISSERMRITSGGNVGINTTFSGINTASQLTIKASVTDGNQIYIVQSNDDRGWRMKAKTDGHFYLQSAYSSGNSDKFMIQYDTGNVGIGTTSPSYRLDLNGGSSDTTLRIQTTGQNPVRLRLTNEERDFILTNNPGDDLLSFFYDNANRLQFNTTNQWFNSGNVGINTSSPTLGKLQVTGDNNQLAVHTTGTYSSIYFYNGGNDRAGIYVSNTETHIEGRGSSGLFFGGAVSQNHMIITPGGNVGIGTTSPSTKLEVNGTITETSSIRYKENIETIKYGLDKILQMRGVTYDRKDSGLKEVGVIAEEINEIFPDLVVKNEEGLVESVSYGRFTALLIEAIKELKIEIEELKANR
jgi:hypothetical protein